MRTPRNTGDETTRTATFPALLLAAFVGCADTPDTPADSATAPEAAPAPTDHAGYVPGNRIDALAVNCKLCDERPYGTIPGRMISWGWQRRSPDHPEWIEYLMYAAENWESAKAEYGANSDEALVVRDELVRLRRQAVGSAERPGARESLAEVAELVEGILLAGGAVK